MQKCACSWHFDRRDDEWSKNPTAGVLKLIDASATAPILHGLSEIFAQKCVRGKFMACTVKLARGPNILAFKHTMRNEARARIRKMYDAKVKTYR